MSASRSGSCVAGSRCSTWSSRPGAGYVRLFDDVGVPYEEWGNDTLRRRNPGIDAGRYWPPTRIDDERFWDQPNGELGAMYAPDAGYVGDPQLAAQNLAAAAHHGAQFRCSNEVTTCPCSARSTADSHSCAHAFVANRS